MPRSTAPALRAAGYRAEDVRDVGLQGQPDAAVYAYAQAHRRCPTRRRLRTTSGQERLNEDVRRGERVIRIFPNRESVVRLVGALLMEYDEQWSMGKRYVDMTASWQARAGHAFSQPQEGGGIPIASGTGPARSSGVHALSRVSGSL